MHLNYANWSIVIIMKYDYLFFINSIMLGVGLAMDAFSVSIANGLKENNMKKSRMSFMAGIYAFFQFFMPMVGWFLVHSIAEYFKKFQLLIPWIALILLLYIGVKMIIEGIKEKKEADKELDTDKEESKDLVTKIAFSTLIIQGIATAIDALSVGFTTAKYNAMMAFISSLIIAAVTFIICFIGLGIGKKAGDYLKDKAAFLGGTILIAIGIEIFLKGIL